MYLYEPIWAIVKPLVLAALIGVGGCTSAELDSGKIDGTPEPNQSDAEKKSNTADSRSSAEHDLNIHDLISDFGRSAVRSIQIGRGKDSLAEAEKRVADKIREAARRSSSTESFLARDNKGATPLIKAAVRGYPRIVAALLEVDVVRANINAKDDKGFDAWVWGNMGFYLSLPACNAKFLNAGNSYRAASFFLSQAYYFLSSIEKTSHLSKKERQEFMRSMNGKAFLEAMPYHEARSLLVNAGANADMEIARTAWMSLCPNQSEDTRAKMAVAGDILMEAMQQGMARTIEARGKNSRN